MKTLLRTIAVATTAGILIVIGATKIPEVAARQDLPEPDASALWNHLEVEEFADWALFPGTSRQQSGEMPHGALVTIYANSTAQRALGSDSLPAGSIIVKENYTPERTLAATTVMYKSPDFDAEHNDWFWLQRLADGTVRASGRVEGCQNCHGQASGRDFVMTPVP